MARIKLRRDTAANWTSIDPILLQGEPGLELDTGKVKYGDGVSTWTNLSYSAGGEGTGVTGFTGSQGIQGNVGFTGSQGITGSQGDIGLTGSQGIQGNVGFTGSQGIQGNVGFTGSQGITGSQGDIGLTGSQGITGFTGSAGQSIAGLSSNGTNTVIIGSGYSLIPETDEQQDLGSETSRFRDLYLSTNTIFLGPTAVGINTAGQITVTEEIEGGEGIGGLAFIQWNSSTLFIRANFDSPFVDKFNALIIGDTFELLTGDIGEFPPNTVLTVNGPVIVTEQSIGDDVVFIDFEIPINAPGSGQYVYLFNLRKIPGGAAATSQVSIITNVPLTPVGSPGDITGMTAYDNSYFYVCIANYDGVSNIWKKVSLEAWS